MARKLAFLLWLLARLGWAQSCPGCDCPVRDCYTPCCDCTLPTSASWCQTMLGRIEQRLVSAMGEKMHLPAQQVRWVRPQLLPTFGQLDGVQGYYDPPVITVSSALTRRECVAVLAHEYGHAWQAQNHPGYEEVDNTLREGFAEWIALQALKRFGFGSGGDILRSNRDPVYGGGLRWFLQVEQYFGQAAVFEQATTWLDTLGKRLPPKKVETPHEQPQDPSMSDDGTEL